MSRQIFLLGLFVCAISYSYAQSVTNTEVSVVRPDAYYAQGVQYGGSLTVACHSQNGIFLADGYIFATFWDADRRLHLSRKSVSSGSSWKDIRFPDVLNRIDSHCTPNVGISSVDGSIHLSYGMHGDTLKYRMSVPGAATVSDADFIGSLFSYKRNYLASPANPILLVTYPTFVVGNNNNLLFFYRYGGSGDGDTYLSAYTSGTGWSTPTKIISRTGTYLGCNSRNAYPNDIRWVSNKLYVTWVWRELTTTLNHDLCYATSTDNGQTWYNTLGAQIGNGSTIMNLNSPGIIAKSIAPGDTLANNMGETVDRENNVHTFLRYYSSTSPHKSTYYHIWRNSSGTWLTKEFIGLSPSLKRPKIFCDVANDVLYAVGVVNNKITIFSAKSTDSFNIWHQIYQGTVSYGEVSGYITFAGNLLYVYAQQNTATATSSELDLIKFTLDPNGSVAGDPIVAQ